MTLFTPVTSIPFRLLFDESARVAERRRFTVHLRRDRLARRGGSGAHSTPLLPGCFRRDRVRQIIGSVTISE